MKSGGQEFGQGTKVEATTKKTQQLGVSQWLGVGVIWGNFHLRV